MAPEDRWAGIRPDAAEVVPPFAKDDEGVWSAASLSHGLRSRIDATGLSVLPLEPSVQWRLGLRTASFGWRSHHSEAPAGTPTPSPEGIERRGELLVEWYRNTSGGLEQGWTISGPPPGEPDGVLQIDIEVEGTLLPRLRPGRRALHFCDGQGEFVLRYHGLRAWDAVGRELEASLLLVGHRIRVEIQARGVAWPVTVDPVIDSSSPDWVASGLSNEYLGNDVSTAGDVNGDGFSDVIVGTQNGTARIYYGTVNGPSGFGQVIDPPDGSSLFGSRVSTAGDIDGDGYDDVLIGDGFYQDPTTHQTVGRVWIFRGSPGGLEGFLTALKLVGSVPGRRFGSDVSTAGDVNGDGVSDILVHSIPGNVVHVLLGAQGTGPGPIPWAEITPSPYATPQDLMSTAGDVNGDGFDDIVISRSYASLAPDEVGIFLGSPSGMSLDKWLITDQVLEEALVANAGDVNGDGYADILVGGRSYDGPNGVRSGRVSLYVGSASGIQPAPLTVLYGEGFEDKFGWSVATAGDVNGDGFADVLVGAGGWDPAHAYGDSRGWCGLWLGRADGLAQTPAWTREGEISTGVGGYLGQWLGTSGDVNGDGYSDIIVSAPYYSGGGVSNRGRVYGFEGSASGLTENSFSGIAEIGLNPERVAIVGDVNGDGFDEVLVGDPSHTNPEPGEGRILLYYGSRDGLQTNLPVWWFEYNEANASFGSNVAPAGDMNGDGFADFMAVSSHPPGHTGNTATVLVWYGASDFETRGPQSSPNWVAYGALAGLEQGPSTIDSAGDVNGDGYGDILLGKPWWSETDQSTGMTWQTGAAFLWLGGPGDPAEPPVHVLPEQAAWKIVGPFGPYTSSETPSLGSDVAGAGDVDGDGFDDVLVAANAWAAGGAADGDLKQARLYLSDGTGPRDQPAWTFLQPEQSFGFSVDGAGDVDGDGKSDVIIGAPFTLSQQKGKVYLYTNWNGLAFAVPVIQEGQQAGMQLGFDVAGAGNLDGDEFADFLAGAPGASMIVVSHSSDSESTVTGLPLSLGLFGRSVAAGGDINGDGFGDLVASMTNDQEAQVFYANLDPSADPMTNPVPRARGHRARQIDPATGARVLLGGGCTDSLCLEIVAYSAAGRQTMRAGWAWGPVLGPYSYFTSPDFDTGSVGPGGSESVQALTVNVSSPYRSYRWGGRLKCFHNPYFPTSPWIYMPSNALREAKFRRIRTHYSKPAPAPPANPTSVMAPQ